ncbi:MAG: right-handed parallel beta-helix repeat-containing protein [Acidimicrobiales bacterium]
MGGSGELYKGSDGKFGFRVKDEDGTVVATEGGTTYEAKAQAREVLTDLLEGDYNGAITDTSAITVTCGQEITESITLEGDLMCPRGPALIIAADNITVDLGGFTISAAGASAAAKPGILLRNVKGVTVRKGTVQRFGAGVAIMGGEGNTIENLTLQDNKGSIDGDFGDGITVQDSKNNVIRGNTVRRNGPFSGIALVGASTGNEVRENVVADNNMLPGNPQDGRQDMGIRIEGPGANNNKIIGNTVTNSGADGIVVLPTCANMAGSCVGTPGNDGNEITDNMSHKNGTSGQGSGIRLFSVANPVAATNTRISGNVCDNNTTFGISIDAAGGATPQPTNNHVMNSQAHGNGQFDGFDGNTPACGSNHWHGNVFGTANQPCVGSGEVPPGPPPPPPPMPPM